MRDRYGRFDVSIGITIAANPGYWLLAHHSRQPASFARCGALGAIMRFDDHLGGADTRYFLLQRHLRLVGVELGHGKFGGSGIDIGCPYPGAAQGAARREMVSFWGPRRLHRL